MYLLALMPWAVALLAYARIRRGFQVVLFNRSQIMSTVFYYAMCTCSRQILTLLRKTTMTLMTMMMRLIAATRVDVSGRRRRKSWWRTLLTVTTGNYFLWVTYQTLTTPRDDLSVVTYKVGLMSGSWKLRNLVKSIPCTHTTHWLLFSRGFALASFRLTLWQSLRCPSACA